MNRHEQTKSLFPHRPQTAASGEEVKGAKGTREALDFFGAAAIFAFEERMSGHPRLSDQVLTITV